MPYSSNRQCSLSSVVPPCFGPCYNMALRQFKKGGVYHILYRDLNGKVRTLSTGDTDKRKAHMKEVVFMATLSAERQRRRHGFTVILPPVNGQEIRDEIASAIDANLKRPQVELSKALEIYRSFYGEPADATRKYFNKFVKNTTFKYMHEITQNYAFSYLQKFYSANSGKSYNEARGALNTIFKRLLVHSGRDSSPFEKLSNKPHKTGTHQRALSESEIKILLEKASAGLKAAIMIAWWTGMRGSSVDSLKWDEIRIDADNHCKYFWHLPPKCARFNRRVKVPIHPQLEKILNELPKNKDGRILGFSGKWTLREFKPLCNELSITDNEEGIVRFGSIRKAFIRRCDAAGIRRSATRGMAGHVSDDITDIYSEDYAGALDILNFKNL